MTNPIKNTELVRFAFSVPTNITFGVRRRIALALSLCLVMILSGLVAIPASAFSFHSEIALKAGQRVGTDSWSRHRLKAAAGDLDGDGNDDFLYIDAPGRLWFYPGTGSNTYGKRVQIGYNYGTATALISGIDYDLDGNIDMIVRFESGRLALYRGRGDGTFMRGQTIGTNWQSMHVLTAVQNGINGFPAVIASNSSGKLRIYPTDGKGKMLSRESWKIVGSGWQKVRLLAGVGDLDGNGRSDLVAVMNNGQMRHYSIKANGYSMSVSRLDHDWSNMAWIGGTGAAKDGFWATHNTGALRFYPITDRKNIPPPTPNPPTKTSLFVYGTLMKGQPAAHHLNGTYQSYKNGTIANTAMYYSQNRAYPYLVHGMSGTAKGEVYYLKDSTAAATLKKTDAYERYDPSKPDSGQLYLRKMLPISHGHSSWVYIAGPEQAVWLKSSGTRIPSGDWLRR